MRRLLAGGIILALALLFTLPFDMAYADTITASSPAYIYTSSPNTTVEDRYMLAGTYQGNPPLASDPGIYLTSVSVSWLVQSGDQLAIKYFDYQGNLIGTRTIDPNTTTPPYSDTPPAGTYAAKLVLTSGDISGDRYFWYESVSNTNGITVLYPAPVSGSGIIGGGGGEPPPPPPPSSDPMLTELQNINSQLNTITRKLNTLIANSATMISQLGLIGDYLSSINSLLSQAVNELQGVNSRLDTVNDKLDTVNSQLSAIKGKLNDIYTYLSTPRTANTITVNPSTPYFSPYPNMPEPPYTTPYQYNRDQYLPQMPPEEPSPGPLPPIPAPTVMEHEPPVQRDQPITKDTPLEREPAIRDQPLQKDPVVRDEPLPRDPVVRDNPLSRDPVVRDSPLSRDPVIQRDTPLQREEPIVRDAPLQRDPPLQPEPPL